MPFRWPAPVVRRCRRARRGRPSSTPGRPPRWRRSRRCCRSRYRRRPAAAPAASRCGFPPRPCACDELPGVGGDAAGLLQQVLGHLPAPVEMGGVASGPQQDGPRRGVLAAGHDAGDPGAAALQHPRGDGTAGHHHRGAGPEVELRGLCPDSQKPAGEVGARHILIDPSVNQFIWIEDHLNAIPRRFPRAATHGQPGPDAPAQALALAMRRFISCRMSSTRKAKPSMPPASRWALPYSRASTWS